MAFEANKELVRRYMEEAWNQGKADVIDELFSPELAATLKPNLIAFRAAFPDWHCEIEDFVAEGDRVVNRWIGRGTHKGDFFGIPATGKSVTLTGVTEHRVENGKIVNDWSVGDQLGLMQQLGAVPSPGSSGA